jgi:hypothetical protein
MMGIEKYFAGLVMILICLVAFSSLYFDSLTASSKTTNTPYNQVLNNTNIYYSGLANQTDIAQNELQQNGAPATSGMSIIDIITYSGQSVALTVIVLLQSLGIFLSLSGIMTMVLPVASIFIGLGVLYVVIMFILSLLKDRKSTRLNSSHTEQ